MTPKNAVVAAVIGLALAGESHAQSIDLINPGFEADFDGWSVSGRGEGLALSGEGASGDTSAKISKKSGLLQQAVTLPQSGPYSVTVKARGPAMIGVKIGERIVFERTKATRQFDPVSVGFEGEAGDPIILFLGYNGGTVRYDDVSLSASGGIKISPSIVRGGSDLIAGVPPAENFDLSGWYLSIPTDDDGNGKSDQISEQRLASGYTHPDYFFTASDGGMTFRTTVGGAKTSHRTKFTRSELREMLRRGDRSIATKRDDGRPNANNWVLSSAPEAAQAAAGAIDGIMEAELAVDHVTTTGKPHEQGRVIIGQIHAKDDEPIRLYYRKLPHHARGSVYFAHETISEPDDLYIDLIGSRKTNADEPANGFKLGERFGYRIDAKGNRLNVQILQDGIVRAEHSLDMSDSGYDVSEDYLYFKAGVYTQNHTGNSDDYDQATFYKLVVTH